jgi:hypothetical protein
MDVGLNNRNTLGAIAPEFADVCFFVEATSNERFSLWQEWASESASNVPPLHESEMKIIEDVFKHTSNFDAKSYNILEKIQTFNKKIERNYHSRVTWQQVGSGFYLQIGKIDKKPITVSFSFDFINGKKICFYEPTSDAVLHSLVEEWLVSHFQLTHDGYTRWNHTNATNFHNCVHSLDNLDKLPRDTVYSGDKISKKKEKKKEVSSEKPTIIL